VCGLRSLAPVPDAVDGVSIFPGLSLGVIDPDVSEISEYGLLLFPIPDHCCFSLPVSDSICAVSLRRIALQYAAMMCA
jgi:hypothetical protein